MTWDQPRSGFNTSSNPEIVDQPPGKRLACNGRCADQLFSPDEPLYIRIQSVTQDGSVPGSAIRYPGSDGMSLNRGKYSLPGDVLYPNPEWLLWGVASIKKGLVPPDTSFSSSPKLFHLHVKHDPLAPPADLLDNFAHSLITTHAEPARSTHVQPSKAVKKGVRQRLAQLFRLLKCPTAATPP